MTACLDTIALLASADLTSAEVALRKIPNDDPAASFVPVVVNLIRTGKASLCEIYIGAEKAGITVYQIDDFEGHKELVSVATYAHPLNRKILRHDLDRLLSQLAEKCGCKSIRFHTSRHGLVSEALKNGWHTAEIVLRKSIP